ncbi:MAG: NADH-quinone oxidoreductase subunit NuoH [Phycisphaerales bacterium]|nr:NADH-quinone oxidoreductase subunit NuoH [Phycisphaerales bacterium]MCB9856160.1 NADH-quinone oxidoreductase subunit NuoH [Phycisphaerales bacterium]
MASITLPWVERNPKTLTSQRRTALTLLYSLAFLHVLLVIASWAWLTPLSSAAKDLTDGRIPLVLILCVGSVIGMLTFVTAALVVTFYRLVGRILAAPWVAFIIFIGAIVGIILLAWLHAEAFAFVKNMAHPAYTDVNPAPKIFGTSIEYEQSVRSIYEQNLEPYAFKIPFVGNVTVLAAYILWPLQFAIVRDLVAVGGIIGFISIVPGFGIWWERKIAGRMQSRMGPMRAGGWHGWAQSAADGIKLIFKEDYVPPSGDGLLFRLAPYFALVPAICAFIALPFAAAWVFRDLDVALIFILAMLGIEVMGVILAGWASNNKWSVYGAMREACQMVSYEIPMGMALLIPVMTAGSLNLGAIAEAQGGGFWTWFIFKNVWCFAAFFIYYCAALASCKRAPFDLPESESELVAGFLTEYSGFRWSLFFFGEYAAMFVISGLATILFLGGWMSPFPSEWADKLIDPNTNHFVATIIRGVVAENPLWFIAKATFMFFLQLWIRWTLPRIRIDQVLYACVQVLLPMMMVVLLGNTLWILAVDHWSWMQTTDMIINWILAALGVAVVIGMLAIASYGFRHNKALVGSMAADQLPGK